MRAVKLEIEAWAERKEAEKSVSDGSQSDSAKTQSDE